MRLDAILQELRDFDTALLANTIGYIDSTSAHEYYMGGSIRSVTPSLGPTVGVAFTCQLDTSSPDVGSEYDGAKQFEKFDQQMEDMSRAREPSVWVVEAMGSRPDHECVAGDGMAKGLYAAGCVGLVTDGGVRDVKGMLSVPFAAYCRGLTIHHCAFRFKSFNQPVEVGGIVVRPGDVLHAGDEGVIKIPKSALELLPDAATRMRAFEHEAHRFFRQTGITSRQKRAHVIELLATYGFAPRRSHAKD